ncbi:AraC family transcriptional regulator [Streptomyces sp. B1866]|uniref:AraC-like ligand-binding domain-containing protein n=1 Tax=Streptomyces sp. B1866 TaxID=3075431 RepID=UPI002890E7F9|nr:AraC family transcriptional regulator [Streptomyces sp. B1866]MDT3396920.1 AraC family transcriptional regulator [Streptomyces sp. B1866]
MIQTVFRGEDLPAEERFPRWLEMVIASHSPNEVSTEHAADFRATLHLLDLGSAQMTVFDSPSLRSRRTERLIRQSDPELYQISLIRRGLAGIVQGAREAALPPGSLVLSTTSRVQSGVLEPDRGMTSTAHLLVPRALLRLPGGADVDRLLAARLPGREGIGGLFARFLTHLVNDPTPYGPETAARLGMAAIDLAAAVVAHHLDLREHPESRPQALGLRVRAFIQRHLDDPALTPDRIAAAHHVSTRSLHRLFEQEGVTVAALIRRERLERARRDLADQPAAGPAHSRHSRPVVPRPPGRLHPRLPGRVRHAAPRLPAGGGPRQPAWHAELRRWRSVLTTPQCRPGRLVGVGSGASRLGSREFWGCGVKRMVLTALTATALCASLSATAVETAGPRPGPPLDRSRPRSRDGLGLSKDWGRPRGRRPLTGAP